MNNDMDGTHAATTVGLLNNSEFTLVYHPAATIFFIHGCVYRMLAVFDPAHQRLLCLTDVETLNDAAQILETATRTSRVLVFFTALGLMLVLYGVLYQMTQRRWLAFPAVFYLMTSYAVMQHAHKIRAEMLNLIFFWAAVYFCWKALKTRREFSLKNWGILFTGIGFLLGLAFFSKIQILPLVLVFAAIMAVYLWRNSPAQGWAPSPSLKLGLVTAAANAVLLPWWALRRPAFLNEEYFAHLTKYTDLWKVYGSAPESFIFPVLGVVGIVAGLFITAVLLSSIGHPWIKKILSITWAFLFAVMGLSLSIWLIFLPLSGSWERYIGNTQHTVYAMLTNMTHGGYLTHRVFDAVTFEKIVWMHSYSSAVQFGFPGGPQIKVNIFYAAMGMLVLSSACLLVKSCRRKLGWVSDEGQRDGYGLVSVLILTGLGMDILTTMRHQNIFDYYVIYSIILYSAGIAYGLVLVLREAGRPWMQRVLHPLLKGALIILLTSHMIMVTYSFLNSEWADGKSAQSPAPEYENTRSHAQPFWNIADQSIQKNVNKKFMRP